MTLFSIVKKALVVNGVDFVIEVCKIPALDPPNQQLTRSKELNDCVCNAFEHFWKTNKYNDIDWQLLMSLDKW